MGSGTRKDKELDEKLRKIAQKAEHFDRDAPQLNTFDGDPLTLEESRMAWATLAQMALDGELDPDDEEA